MGTLDRLIKRFQQLLGGNQEDRNDQSQKQEVNQNEIESHINGPIADGRRTNESRVLYHYPKQGKFRFPLIEDEEENNRAKRKTFHVREEELKEERKQISDQKVSQEKKVEVQEVDTRFGNRDFKRTSVPSPVYGFRGREETKSRIGDTLTVSPFENKKQQDTSDIPSTASPLEKLQSEPRAEEEQKTSLKKPTLIDEPDFVEGLLPNEEVAVTLETETTKESIIETETVEVTDELTINSVEIEETKALTTVPAAIEVADESLINSVEMEIAEVSTLESAEGEGTKQKSTVECDESEAATAHSPIESVGREVEDATVTEFDHEEVAQIVEADQISAEKSRKQEVVDSVSEKPVDIVEEPQTESPDVTTPSTSYEKPAIPFNVMMLPQDRRSKQAPQRVEKPVSSNYQFPSIQLLDYPQVQQEDESEWLEDQGMLLEETLQSFHVDAKVVHVTKGPSVTRFEIQPARGVKVNKVTGLTDDIKLALAAKDIRIEAPIPGKNTIGIEVPNRTSTPVFLREILRRDVFVRPDSPLTVALGLDISGQPIVTDLKKMPHGLVAGATGSGKSVCINSVLISLLFKASPDEVKLMLIDPKMVELAPYNGLPHLVTPVITDAKQATAALKWVVQEMERRYELFSQQGVRDVGRYNSLYSESPDKPALPYILVVIDELADLMMVSPQDVEDAICRIAQKARACGIHLLLATQRPSVDVITGLIKANIPTRIAFSVSSQTDSRTILDMGGAERLLGRGDMLFHENGTPKPVRVQGTFVSDEEIEDVIAHVKKQRDPEYLLEIEQLKRVSEISDRDDEHFEEACYFVIEQGSASASSLQRRFRVGYNRAARLIDMMEERGIISEAMGSKPRHVLVDEIELEELLYHKEG